MPTTRLVYNKFCMTTGTYHHWLKVVNAPHKAELSHELLAAAASYEAAKAYEKHCEENGKPDSHA